ncbi:LacI family transcriptional regulator [Verrucomicrobiales bacterium]|nr:LacI family transcriptional regulator [Verrucomicrobiales bacterium]
MNISELARELGVAVSTVSRVLSGNAEKYRISQKTVVRVQEAAEKFQVTPDPIGAGLRRGKMGIVGLLVPDITNSFFAQLARAIELRLRASGVAVQLCDSAEDPETENALLEKMLGRRLDGLIVAPVGNSSPTLLKKLQNPTMPIVMVDRPLPGLDSSLVSLNNLKAGRLAAERLLREGHCRIACLRGDPASESDQERLEGVRDALKGNGIDPEILLSEGTGYSREQSLEAARLLLTSNDRPTGIITLSGQGILGLLATIRELSLKIPHDLSLVAFDEQPWSPLIDPPLTTVAQPVSDMATKVVEILRQKLDTELTKERYELFDAKLIDRSSVSSPFAR